MKHGTVRLRNCMRRYAIYDQAEGAEQAVFDPASGAAASRSQRLIRALPGD